MFEVLTHYSKRARHYLEQYEVIQTALNNQAADTTSTHSVNNSHDQQLYNSKTTLMMPKCFS